MVSWRSIKGDASINWNIVRLQYIDGVIEDQGIEGKTRRILDLNMQVIKCEICEHEIPVTKVEIHHVIPVGNITRREKDFITNPRNMMAICKRCHAKIHKNDNRRVKVDSFDDFMRNTTTTEKFEHIFEEIKNIKQSVEKQGEMDNKLNILWNEYEKTRKSEQN